jgi:UDP-glucose 4-epimerase
MKNRTVLITGAFGFIGQYVASEFKKNNYFVIGIGHGCPTMYELERIGIDDWYESDINFNSLKCITKVPNYIVHCAGNGSVGLSVENPIMDFNKNVNTTLDVLEFIRVCCPEASLIYLSSAAVYGAKEDNIINENDYLNPVSPYGFHKLTAETLCKSYYHNFGLKIAIVRFFSIFGEGLKKQLLWDACNKIANADKQVVFYGTGSETRDWLYVTDAAKLIVQLIDIKFEFKIINGASGDRVTVKDILNLLKKELNNNEVKIIFNNHQKIGDPKFYHADMNAMFETGWKPEIQLATGLTKYVNWFNHLL